MYIILNKMEETTFTDNDSFLVLFSKKITRRQPFRKSRDDIPSEKVVIVEEELNDMDIGNLEDLPRLVSRNDKCENLKVVMISQQTQRRLFDV